MTSSPVPRSCSFCRGETHLAIANEVVVCARCAVTLGEFLDATEPGLLREFWVLEEEEPSSAPTDFAAGEAQFKKLLEVFEHLPPAEAARMTAPFNGPTEDAFNAMTAQLTTLQVKAGNNSGALDAAAQVLSSLPISDGGSDSRRAATEACLRTIFSEGFFRPGAFDGLKARLERFKAEGPSKRQVDNAPDGSAPGRVDALKPWWQDFDGEKREQLAHRWMDHCVRRVLASACDKHRCPELGTLLRTLPTITDPGTKVRATAVVDTMTKGKLPNELFQLALTVLVFLKDRTSIARVCFMTVMTSRTAFGDDRLVAMMEQDLVALEGR